MIITAVTVGAIGLVHYFFWGREFLKDVAPARAAAATLARTERDSVQPAPPVILELTERHRVELIRVLEEWLATTGTAARSAPQSRDTNEAVREALDKLRSFGA